MNEDRATRYHRLRRRAGVASLLTTAATLIAFCWSGLRIRLRDALATAVAGVPGAWNAAVLVAAYAGVVGFLMLAASAPWHWYGGYVLDRRYGLSKIGRRAWLVDYVKGVAIGGAIGLCAVEVLYALARHTGAAWWVWSAVAFTAGSLVLTHLAPIVLLPIFFALEPLPSRELAGRLLRLAERAGLPALGAYAWGLGARSHRANAALVGLGRTRRILVSDTMLDRYSDDEIEVVLAHELAHHARRHIPKALALDALVTLVSLGAAHLALSLSPGIQGAADVAGLPILVLVASACSIVASPFLAAVSRAHEREADRFAIALTEKPSAFVSAMRRLADQNLAEARPPRLAGLFHSHPPLEARLAAATAHGVENAPAKDA